MEENMEEKEQSTHGRTFYQLLNFLQYPPISKYEPSTFDYLFEKNDGSQKVLKWLGDVVDDATFVAEAQLKEYETWNQSGGVPLDGAELEIAYGDYLLNNGLGETEEDLELELTMLEAQKKALVNEQKKLEAIKQTLKNGIEEISEPAKENFPRLKLTSGVDLLHLPLESLYETSQRFKSGLQADSLLINNDLDELMNTERNMTNTIQSCASLIEDFVSEVSENSEKKKVLYADLEHIYERLPELAERLFAAQCEKSSFESEVSFITDEIQHVMYRGGWKAADDVLEALNKKRLEVEEVESAVKKLRDLASESKYKVLHQMCDEVMSSDLARLEEVNKFIMCELLQMQDKAKDQLSLVTLLRDTIKYENNQLVVASTLFSRASKILNATLSTDRVSYLAKSIKLQEEVSSDSIFRLIQLYGLTDHCQRVGTEHCLTEFLSSWHGIHQQVSSWIDKKSPLKIAVILRSLERGAFGEPLKAGLLFSRDCAIEKLTKDLDTAVRAFENEIKKLTKTQKIFTKEIETRPAHIKRRAWIYFLTDPAEFRRVCKIGH